MLLTGLFLIAAMAILVMKGREEQVQLQKRYEELLMDFQKHIITRAPFV